jgi:hypothetical protein
MSDPRNRGAAAHVPTKGEGCTRRFDPDAMSDAHGADFGDAPRLWHAFQEQAASTSKPATESGSIIPAAETFPENDSGR